MTGRAVLFAILTILAAAAPATARVALARIDRTEPFAPGVLFGDAGGITAQTWTVAASPTSTLL
jgi:hypothetical protein